MPRNVPYKDFSGVPGIKVSTYSTPTCDEHIDAERAGNGCPYCAIKMLLATCAAPVDDRKFDYAEARGYARTVLSKRRR